jgi:hypothetical protein
MWSLISSIWSPKAVTCGSCGRRYSSTRNTHHPFAGCEGDSSLGSYPPGEQLLSSLAALWSAFHPLIHTRRRVSFPSCFLLFKESLKFAFLD